APGPLRSVRERLLPRRRAARHRAWRDQFRPLHRGHDHILASLADEPARLALDPPAFLPRVRRPLLSRPARRQRLLGSGRERDRLVGGIRHRDHEPGPAALGTPPRLRAGGGLLGILLNSFPRLLCGGGGTADALGSGPSGGKLLEVRILSAAPLCV